MKNKVQIHKYKIDFDSSPNALTPERIIEGALIKYDGGHGCLQPWPSLGDNDLTFHLSSIIENNPTDQVLACLKCCRIDAEARIKGIDLFDGLNVPKSHFAVPYLEGREISTALKDEMKNFSHVKVKANNKINELAVYIENLPRHLSIRVDFNSSLEPSQLIEFTTSLSTNCLQRIDFIEDPFPYEPDMWKRHSEDSGVNFALDRGPKNANIGFAVRIWKPSVFCSEPVNMPICVTHNMDHELGKRYATYQSSVSKNAVTVHGTGSFDYSKNGTGLGMDEFLESLQWEDLK